MLWWCHNAKVSGSRLAGSYISHTLVGGRSYVFDFAFINLVSLCAVGEAIHSIGGQGEPIYLSVNFAELRS